MEMEEFIMGVTPVGVSPEKVDAQKAVSKDSTMNTNEFFKLKNEYVFGSNDDCGRVPGLSTGEFESLFHIAERMKYSKDPKIAEVGKQQADELMAMANLESKTKYAHEDRMRLLKKANEQRQRMSETMDARYKAGFFTRLFGNVPSEAEVDAARKALYLANREVYLHRDLQISIITITEYYRDKK